MPTARHPVGRLWSRAHDALRPLRPRAQAALGRLADRLTARRVERRIATGRLGDLTIVAYHGWGTPEQLFVRARVLESAGTSHGDVDDPWWRNAAAMVRRFWSTEIPGAVVDLDVGPDTHRLTANAEGHVQATVPSSLAGRGWQPLRWALHSPPVARPVVSAGRALVPRADAAFGVISDLDDTVIRTGVTDRVGMLRTVLFTNARTRLPFPGVDALYDALAAGGSNPVFYVSTSPWNLYDVLEEVLRVRGIPAGPMFLTDWGIDERTLGQPDTHEHKRTAIQRVLDAYPELPFVLIGDSGQHDPEIYAGIVATNPGRIRAVYVRDVDVVGRDAEVEAIATRLAASGVDLVHSDDTVDLARHAASIGLLDDDVVERVAASASG